MSGQGSYGMSVWRAGFNEITSSGEEKTGTPGEFALHQNYPNPFNPSTRLNFTLPEDSKVKLIIYNGLGEEVREPVNSEFPAGRHQIDFDAAGLPSGVYFCRMEAAGVNTSGRGNIVTIRMTLLK